MALHHFFWRGRERTVSVRRKDPRSLQLLFLDEEVAEALGSHAVVLDTSGGVVSPDLKTAPTAQDLVASVLAALPNGLLKKES